jgi:hypothetical protein
VKSDLIDRIYECSVLPDLWPGVLDELAELTDSRGGLLFSARASGAQRAGGDPGDGAGGAAHRTDAVAVRLTPSEARVARGLALGETLEEIALLANVTLDRSAPEN